MTTDERQKAILELYCKLGEAEAQSSSRKGWVNHKDMMKELRTQI